jgi:hypothetical protein
LLSVSEKGVEISPSSSGGGGGGLSCIEKFGCEEWSECYFLDEAMYNTFDFNLTFSLKRNCSLSGWNTSVCGFQTRQCKQLNKCISNYSRTFIQSCYYSKNPSCYDEIKNCHDGSC